MRGLREDRAAFLPQNQPGAERLLSSSSASWDRAQPLPPQNPSKSLPQALPAASSVKNKALLNPSILSSSILSAGSKNFRGGVKKKKNLIDFFRINKSIIRVGFFK